MKKTAISILAFVAAMMLCSAQPNPEFAQMIRSSHAAACLNTCPYELNPMFGDFTDSPAPKGYKPVYISHYGRHGSRSSWEQRYYDDIVRRLTAAKKAGILTASGDSLLAQTQLVIDGTAKMEGRLTPRGAREHRGIADRMYHRYKRVFTKGSRNIRVLSSEVPRCLVSMASFTLRLGELDNRLTISMDCGSEIQKEVSNSASEESSALRSAIRDSMRNALAFDTAPVMTRIFSDTAKARTFVPDASKLCKEIYYTARISRSFDYDFDMFRFLPDDVIYGWADIHNTLMYLGQCNSELLGDDRMPLTKPLAENIVRLADDALSSGQVAADLRFGHDYPLLAVCSYFGLEGVGERYSLEEARRHWIATYYTPFAGNLQLIFYKSRKAGDPVLVKFLLNEKETSVPALQPVSGPYYRWDDVRAFVQARPW